MRRSVDRYIRIEINRRQLRQAAAFAFSCLLLAGLASELASENVTLTTYYPAPTGIYTKMITTGDATLARDGGNVGVGTPASASYKLNVSGTANVSSSLSANAVYGNYIQSRGGLYGGSYIYGPGYVWGNSYIGTSGYAYAYDYWIGSVGHYASAGATSYRYGGQYWVGSSPGDGWNPKYCAPGYVVTGIMITMSDTWRMLCSQIVSR